MAFHYWGRWGGLGYSDGHYTTPNEIINWQGIFDDPVDEQFRAHDHAYDTAQRAYDASAKTDLDRTLYWAAIIRADTAVKNALLSLIANPSLGALLTAVAAGAMDLFTAKNLTFNYPAYMNGRDPNDVTPSTSGDPFTGMPWPVAISTTLGTTPDPLIKIIRYVDPLILDLDGDGLEITPLAKGILFDANGDSIKTATAWAGADDGLLVLDLNGNGLIDSGRELFGDETILTSGANAGQKAAHGFAALADLDSNADGKFDSADAQYANLRIWRDLNQDGISQAAELKTLTASNVQSISLGSTASGANQGDAILVQSGSFTRADGSTGQAGSFILAQNNFVTSFTPITVSAEARGLPGIAGSAWVRDLQEAATENPELIALVNQAKDAPTRAGYRDAVASLMRDWGNDSAYNSASKQALVAGYGLILSDPLDAQEALWMDTAIKASGVDRDAYRATLSPTDLAKFDAMRERMVGGLEQLHAYEAFTGYSFLSWAQVQGDATNFTPRSVGPGGRVPVEVWIPLSQLIYENRNAVMSSQSGYIRVTIPAPLSGMAHAESLWNRLVDDASKNLMQPLRLSQYVDKVDLNISALGISFDFSRLNAALLAASTANVHEGATLLLDLYRNNGAMLMGMGWNGTDQLNALTRQAAAQIDIRNAFGEIGYNFLAAGATSGTQVDDVFSGDASADSFSAGAGNDLLDGQDGNDTLAGGVGDDVLFGGAGDDILRGDDGADILDGGTGNDTLYGGAGNNSYLFGKGDGQDLVHAFNDATTGKRNTLQLKAGIAPSEVVLRQVYDSDLGGNVALELSIAGSTDKITLNGFFYNNDPANTYNSLQQVRFADGLTWDVATVLAKLYAGTSDADTITGTIAADTINGAAGDDTLHGRDGNDVLNGDMGNDTLYGDAGDDSLFGGAGNDYLYGDAGNDTMYGGDGDDIIQSQYVGADTIDGGAGNDNIVVDYSGQATILFGRGDGQDTVWGAYSLFSHTTPDTVQFKAGITAADVVARRLDTSLVLTINGTNDKLTIRDYFYFDGATRWFKESGAKTINPVQQFKFADGSVWIPTNDTIGVIIDATSPLAYLGVDNGTNYDDIIVTPLYGHTYYGWGGNDEMNGSSANNTFDGGDGNDLLFGDAGDDMLYGVGGDDWLDGGTGNDIVFGGTGSDTYVFGRGAGQDSFNNERAANAVETDTLLLVGLNPNDVQLRRVPNQWDPLGDSLELSIVGSTDTVLLVRYFQDAVGVEGDYGYVTHHFDRMQFADGTVWDRSTILSHVPIANLTLTGTAGADTLVGGAGNDLLDGGAGNDTMRGGLGDDTYIVDSIGDVVTELLNEGTDLVQSSVTYTLAANLESLTLTGTSAINGTGNTLNNVLVGNSAANTLSGGTGADTMQGGAGNDIYVVDNISDVVTENLNEGTDLVQSSVSYTLSANIENLTLTSTTAINGTGNALNNTLTGSTGNNILDGGMGADTMVGGTGNDTYYVDNVGDITTEAASAGTDTVFSSINWTLGTNLENLTLSGTANINATGNTVANILTGNSGDNVLNGGAGTDTMIGGMGNDTYLVDVATDVVTEGLNAGIDLVQAGVTYTLGANVENLTLTGTNAFKGTGNALDNVLTGNSAANVLTGGAGNDTYIVGTGDTTIEAVGAGTDTVQSSITWTLATNVENLTLMGSSAVNGIGNTADNILIGNTGVNTLTGNAGNDTLDGGAGADILIGGTGNDTYRLGRGYGADSITENDTTAGNTDVLQFLSGVATDQIWLRKVSNNLEISIIGTTDKATLTNWYLGNQYHVEQFKTSDGKRLLDSQVQNLVSAMAAFSPPPVGQMTLSASYAAALSPVIVANWQ